MKRAAFLIIPLLLLAVLVVVVVAEIPHEEEIPADVQACLEQYITDTYPSERVTVQAAQRVRKPWAFSSEMSRLVYGDSVHFQTDTGPTRTQRVDLAALPYPPKEVWCALLDIAGGEGGSQVVVFVALHMDMYFADLVVHETQLDLSSPELAERLSTIGCSLGAD